MLVISNRQVLWLQNRNHQVCNTSFFTPLPILQPCCLYHGDGPDDTSCCTNMSSPDQKWTSSSSICFLLLVVFDLMSSSHMISLCKRDIFFKIILVYSYKVILLQLLSPLIHNPKLLEWGVKYLLKYRDWGT